MNENKRIAKQYLTHYFKLLFESSGLRWDYDNQAEIEDIVDLIIKAVIDDITQHSDMIYMKITEVKE